VRYPSGIKAYAVILLVLLVGLVAGVAWLLRPVGGDTEPVMVSIPRGASASVIAERLKDRNLIRSRKAFVIVARLSGKSTTLKPGAYSVTRNMSLTEIIDKIESGDVAAVWVTIPEGFTVRQIAETLAKRDLVTEEEFLLAAGNGGSYGDIPTGDDGSLEGFLFPDTYLIPLDSNAESVVRIMLQTFRTKVAEPYAREIEECELSVLVPDADNLRSVIIVASLIEREAKVPEDREKISGVIHNRLRRGMRLEIDATVQYARGEHKSRLFYRDLGVNSPYNTYLYGGLPPGPIANPGAASVKAALNPAGIDALFYVARKDGTHIFSKTLAEHNAARRKIRSGN
jgi:UPF0755 protein